jgi:divalent metal cation (Fe/Co/Zn/Cd) transporter
MSDYLERKPNFNIIMQDSDLKEELNRKIKEIILQNKNPNLTIKDVLTIYFNNKVFIKIKLNPPTWE